MHTNYKYKPVNNDYQECKFFYILISLRYHNDRMINYDTEDKVTVEEVFLSIFNQLYNIINFVKKYEQKYYNT